MRFVLGFPRGRGQTEMGVHRTREEISPPAFLGTIFTCLQDIYTGISVQVKTSIPCSTHTSNIEPVMKNYGLKASIFADICVLFVSGSCRASMSPSNRALGIL